jgi:hypothetical protein
VGGGVDLHPEASTVCLGNKGLDALNKFVETHSIVHINRCKQRMLSSRKGLEKIILS